MSRKLWIALALGLLLGCPDEQEGLSPDDDAGDDDDSAGDDDTGDPATVDEEFVQTGDPADVLFVVDNSCSMQEEQQALMDNFGAFFTFLQDNGIDYHIGITVLDDWPTQSPIGQLYGSTRYIEPTTPDAHGAFVANMTMGSDGMGACEVGLEASHRALTEPLVNGYNAGFYREDARLAIAVVSDEVDGSTTDCQALGHAEYLAWLSALKPDGLDRVLFAAIVGDQPTGCSSVWGEADAGHGYHEVVAALAPDHSEEHSICDHDWSAVMGRIGAWASVVQTVFELGAVPVEGTLTVFIDLDGAGPEAEFEAPLDPTYAQDHAYAWDEDDNAVVFHDTTAPPVGAVIRAEYEPEP